MTNIVEGKAVPGASLSNFVTELNEVQILWHARFETPADMVTNNKEVGFPDGKEWTLGPHFNTIEEAAKSIAEGRVPQSMFDLYLELRDKLESLVDKFAGLGKTTKRRRVYGDEGDEIDMDRLMVSNPDFWVRRKRGAKRKVVRLVVRATQTAGDSAEEFAFKGALAAAAADLLQRLGYAVEIIAACGGKWNAYWIAHEVVLKPVEVALDPQMVMLTGLQVFTRGFFFPARRNLSRNVNCYVHPYPSSVREYLEWDYVVEKTYNERKRGTELTTEGFMLESFFKQAYELAEQHRRDKRAALLAKRSAS